VAVLNRIGIIGFLSTLTLACSDYEDRSQRRQNTEEKSSAVLSISAGIHINEVKSINKGANDPDDTGKVKATSETLPVQSQDQSPYQSPSQSPYQSPTQSPPASTDIAGVTIKNLSYIGSGCPEGTVASNLSPDAKAFTLLFDSFFIEAGPATKGVPATATSSCKLNLTLLAPSGWQVAILSVDYRGFADLAAGDSAVISERISLLGSPSHSVFSSKVDGPHSDNFQTRSEVLLKSAQWSRCEGIEKTLQIEFSAEIKSTTDAPASLSLDTVDGELSYKSGIVWRRCL